MSEIVTRKVYMTAKEVLDLDWKKNPRPMRDRGGGLYRIVERGSGRLVYVGQASDLAHRLTPSQHPVLNRKLHDVYVLWEQDYDERRNMEGQFVQLLKPRMNVRNGTMPKPTEAMKTEYYRKVFG